MPWLGQGVMEPDTPTIAERYLATPVLAAGAIGQEPFRRAAPSIREGRNQAALFLRPFPAAVCLRNVKRLSSWLIFSTTPPYSSSE